MSRGLKRWWRALRTALAFAAYGVLSLALAFVIVPIAIRLHRDEPTDLLTQRLIHRVNRAYVVFLEATGIMRWRVSGTELLGAPGRQLIVANHPTLLDYVFLTALLPQADCIVSSARAENPFLSGAVRAARYVRNDVGHEIVRECVERLAAGRTLIIFPEGTRSPTEGMRAFKRGAARIALEAACDLQPVAIHCDPPTLRKGQKWYDVPDRAFQLSIQALEPVRSAPAREALRKGECSPGVAARRITAEVHEAIAKGLANHDVRNA